MSDWTPTNRQTLDGMVRAHGAHAVEVRDASGDLGGHDVYINGRWAAWMWAIGTARETCDQWRTPAPFDDGAAFSVEPDPIVYQWHERRSDDEPECPPGKWRTSERDYVVDIRQMEDRHLAYSERLARDRPQHAVKHVELLAELGRRLMIPLPPKRV